GARARAAARAGVRVGGGRWRTWKGSVSPAHPSVRAQQEPSAGRAKGRDSPLVAPQRLPAHAARGGRGMFRAMVQRDTTEAQIAAVLGKGKRMPAERLLPLVYDELRRLARSRVARLGPGQTVRATELVHEAWLRVVAGGDPGWEGRGHFFGAAAN